MIGEMKVIIIHISCKDAMRKNYRKKKENKKQVQRGSQYILILAMIFASRSLATTHNGAVQFLPWQRMANPISVQNSKK